MKYFGTDGIRGVVGKDLNARFIKSVATAIAQSLDTSPTARQSSAKKIIIGHDTRSTGELIVSMFTDIFVANDIAVIDVGILPTTALAFLTQKLEADMGVMITASHNPPQYNGIKLFSSSGEKMDGEPLERIDTLIDELHAPKNVTPERIATPNYLTLWQDYLVGKFSKAFSNFPKPRIALDCANGVGFIGAENVLKRLGFDVTAYNTQSNGVDVNVNCGSMHPEFLASVDKNFDVGFAFDGDADRCVVFDNAGRVVHGDVLIALLAGYMNARTVVSTVMFNTGVEKFLNTYGIKVIRTAVGDKFVIAELNKHATTPSVIGGESSGHIIFPQIFPAGDGLITALVVLEMIVKSGRTMHELCAQIPVWHSILKNVKHDIEAAEYMQDDCRVLIRKSGTENLTRILVEGEHLHDCEKILDEILTKKN